MTNYSNKEDIEISRSEIRVNTLTEEMTELTNMENIAETML